jgi:hypothetical protein
LSPRLSTAGYACSQPDTWSIAAAFDLAANGLLPASYPQFPAGSTVRAIPPSVLKAVGWVESGWRQFTPQGRPLVSFDFGYGIMQVTSGMAGAFGDVLGSIDPQTQSRIASDYTYNIAYGAQMLVRKWTSTPQVGDGDPSLVEDWYYALWAYNGWGWVNNPNNPRFTRNGTPATDPSAFPYQERVLYLVAHPPRDKDGNPLWRPVHVVLPARKEIGKTPGALQLKTTDREEPATLAATYHSSALKRVVPGETQTTSVEVTNTGTSAWPASGTTAVSLVYHLFTTAGNPWGSFSPFSNGVVALGQGLTPLTHDLLPAQSASLRVIVVAPSKPGTYRLAWDLQQGSGTWFSQLGVLPRVRILHVLTAGAAPPSPPSATPTPLPQARESLFYVADTSAPDGTVIAPQQRFVKGWLVFNNGESAWQSGWALHLVSGKSFGAKRIAVPLTVPCRSANVVATLRAPKQPGSYRSVWEMRDPAGHTFGEKLTLVVTVQGTGTRPTPLPTPTPHPRKTAVPPTPTPVG